MKKYKLGIITTLLIVLVVLLVLYTSWQNKSYKDAVHTDATTIIKINLVALGKTIAWDYLGNWKYYSSKDIDSIKSTHKKENGINIPANLFLYTVPKASNTVFCTLQISDSTQAISYLSKELGLSQDIKEEKFYHRTNKKGTISLAQLDQTIILAFSYKKEGTSKVFEDLLVDKKYMMPTHDLLQKAKKEEHHLSILEKKNSILSLDSKDGKIEFTSKIKNSSYIHIKETQEVPSFSKKSSIQMYIAGDIKDNVYLQNKLENILRWDTTPLFKNYNGLLSFQLKGHTLQKDSIITYEYTDDFEKVPVVSIKEKKVPKMMFSFKTDSTNSIESFLKNKGIISENRFVKQMPLYQYYAKQKANEFKISTSKDFMASFQKTEISTTFFRILILIDPLLKENHFPIINPYISSMTSIDIKAKKVAAQSIDLKGIITFKENTINALTQILKK
ncbi:hypothetical protein [Aquimarina muelleri]|uniref:Uncharacterized protein n=1 Tax=Aquimarina muelleri TaxID=279356 RepID=A0A918JTG5_9FLAO|nr:hypothetical protein [Aquimarina muelleri]MCX2761653.1 hypothetical protein [Aquimarina muelleri]GGX07315.1 hypothetical protein GCM10007384_06110 [Aquimarina muelleri]